MWLTPGMSREDPDYGPLFKDIDMPGYDVEKLIRMIYKQLEKIQDTVIIEKEKSFCGGISEAAVGIVKNHLRKV